MATRMRSVTVTPMAAGDAPDFEPLAASALAAMTESVLEGAAEVFEVIVEVAAGDVVGLETGVVVTGAELGVSDVVEVVVVVVATEDREVLKRPLGSVADSSGDSDSLVG
jgi:hypothetical protein